MKFSPKTAQEIAEANMWPAGTFEFEVLEAEDTISKNGNEMIKLKVKIFNDEGKSITLTDYLLDSMPSKLRHAAEAFDLLAEYEAGGFDAIECEGKTGKLKLKVGKEQNGYPAKNEIADYVPTVTTGSVERSVKRAQKAPANLDDEIPF